MANEQTPGMNPDCGETVDFMSAIEAHVRWKVRLEAYIAGTSDEKLDADVVCRDDQCMLGKWIHGNGGQKHGSHPRFVTVKDIHAEFHRSAGDVVLAVDAGEKEKAKELLCKGDYASSSHRIKAELARLALELEE
jgi:hypothetical protein